MMISITGEKYKELKDKYGYKDCLVCGARNCFLETMTENASLYRCKNCGEYFIPHWYIDHLRGVRRVANKLFNIHSLKCYMFYHKDDEYATIIAPIEKQYYRKS